MEKLKSVIPQPLKHKISLSTAADLNSTSSSLLDFFRNLPLFHKLVKDLTDLEVALCGKNKEAAQEAKSKGNECFSQGDYSNALHFYSQALRYAPMDVEDNEKTWSRHCTSIALHHYINWDYFWKVCRIAPVLSFCILCMQRKTFDAFKSLESSFSNHHLLIILLEKSLPYQAWFRRAKANSSLGNYEDAINDFSVSLKIETSLSGKRQIENELDLLLNQSRLRSSAAEKQHDGSSSTDEPLQMELLCVSIPSKGKGMISLTNMPLASLIHKEDPYAAVILKPCRDTHCAFCFNELRADSVPCISCSIPLYCSLKCQVQAGGEDFLQYKTKYGFQHGLSDDLEQHMRNVTSLDIFSSESSDVKHFAEHRHECQGMHWPVVLPSDVVLAGRILVKHTEEPSYGGLDIKDLCQNYGQLSSETKLEFHVYSVILLCCLQRFNASKLPLNSALTSEIIMLLSKIRINSMAVVQMKYSDVKQSLDYDVTSSVDQIQVAQAVYSRGSLFNHSCQPNVHAYFLSRTLFIRATENVSVGSELELSYGPQVGQWDCAERQKLLKERYTFICQCVGCAQLNLSDLLHSGYRCIKPICDGVVLDSTVANYEKEKIKHCEGPSSLLNNTIGKVAHHMLEQTDCRCLEPGCCLGCATLCDLQVSKKTIVKAEINIQRMKDAVASGALTTNLIMDGLRYTDMLRAVLHPSNKRIAEVEDSIAQAFCVTGNLPAALEHCRASIEILEKLYGKSHIAIGNELIKLVSIQYSMGQEISTDYTNRIVAIFSRYYGSHAEIMFPHVQFLKKEERVV